MEHVFTKIENYLANRDKTVPSVIPYVFRFVVIKNGQTLTTWTLDLKQFQITKTSEGDADVTLTVDEETLGQLVTLKVSIEDAVKSGGLKINGKMEVALKIGHFLGQLQ